jgi:hypothetical protein
MIEDPLKPIGDGPPGEQAVEDQRRLLELQLIKVRSEASAARLEARAAEIELMIRQLAVGHPAASSTSATSSAAPINPPHIPPPPSTSRQTQFGSWDEVRSVMPANQVTAEPALTLSASAHPASVQPTTDQPATLARFDAAEPAAKRPYFLDHDETGPEGAAERVPEVQEDRVEAADPIAQRTEPADPASPLPVLVTDQSRSAVPVVSGQVSIEADSDQAEDVEKRRGKPAAWLVSAVAHVGILLILAAITLQTQRPRDQVALSASAAEANEVSMETFTIESSEPEPESEPTPSETQYELSPVGEIAATDFAPDAPPAPPSPAAMAMTASMLSSAAAKSLKSDSDAKIQFCGVEGGGNHFVYLVDSSKSMGDGFESARRELLASIEVLKTDQRFYVVFFDAQPDYMRLSDANRDETRSTSATPKNKAALKRWAMRIAMDNGRAPYDPLRFALKLRPDVIFLLSDGEFPQGIEDLLREENKSENLFGDSGPISIVHTISYHSKEGESRMRRIAEQNKGQYRYIPKP